MFRPRRYFFELGGALALYVVLLVGGAFTLLTVTADVVNPITIR